MALTSAAAGPGAGRRGAGARGRAGLAALAVAGLAAALLWPSLDYAWLNYDDDVYVTANPNLALGLGREGVVWAFTTFHGANWFPLTWLSWLLDFELHGLDAAGFRATNVALHAATAGVLTLALARATGAVGRSAFVAAVFATHPLHLESVIWVAARKDPLSGLFFALALLVYVPGVRGAPPSRGRLIGVFACMALGLMAKPVLVTLPCVLLLLDHWPLARLRDPARRRRALLEKLPLLALAAVFCAVVLAAQRAGGALVTLERLPWTVRLANVPVAYVGYLAKAFWPDDLAVFYPHPGEALALWRALACAGGLLALTGLVLAAARRWPYLAVGWLWFAGMLVPMIGLVQVGSQAMADRYTYLPLIGLALAVTWAVADALGPRRRALAGALGVAAVAALAVTSAQQLRHWRDSESLFRHALAVTGDNPVAHAHLGSALLARGEVAAAVDHYSAAIRLRPDFLEVANNLAWLLATAEDEEHRNPYLALRLAERAAELTEGRDPAVLDTLAAAYAASGRFRPAMRAARRALALLGEEEASDAELARGLAARLSRYEQGRAYTEPAAATGATGGSPPEAAAGRPSGGT